MSDPGPHVRSQLPDPQRTQPTPRELLLGDIVRAALLAAVFTVPLGEMASRSELLVDVTGKGLRWLPAAERFGTTAALAITIWFGVAMVLFGVLRLTRVGAAEDAAERDTARR